jgi:hypothetical protein
MTSSPASGKVMRVAIFSAIFVALLLASSFLFVTALSHGSQEPSWIHALFTFLNVVFFPLTLLGFVDRYIPIPETLYEVLFLLLWLLTCTFWSGLAVATFNRLHTWRAKIV